MLIHQCVGNLWGKNCEKEGDVGGRSLVAQESSIDNTCPRHLDRLYLTKLHDPKYEFLMLQQANKIKKEKRETDKKYVEKMMIIPVNKSKIRCIYVRDTG